MPSPSRNQHQSIHKSLTWILEGLLSSFPLSRCSVSAVIAFSILINVTRFFELRQVESTVTVLEEVNDTLLLRFEEILPFSIRGPGY